MLRSLFLLSVLSFSSLIAQEISVEFLEKDIPESPIYSSEAFWSTLPWREDCANLTPSENYCQNQDSARVDVFFIHPTTLNKKHDRWNAELTDSAMNHKVDNLPIMHQSTIFNRHAKVYAPRYRQANYESFMALENLSSQKALGLAYSDVKASFMHYLENWNNGRPFIIAGHSQGTFHAMRLIGELIDTTDLKDRMVVAYLVGMPIMEDEFQNVPPCEDELDINCFLTWNTMKRKKYPEFYEEYFKGAVCHNPLSWTMDETYYSKKNHISGVPKNFNKPFKRRYGARVNDGILWVDPVNLPGIPFTRFVKSWHIGDYNLFYGNVRQNVGVRVAEYLTQQGEDIDLDVFLEEQIDTIPDKDLEVDISLE